MKKQLLMPIILVTMLCMGGQQAFGQCNAYFNYYFDSNNELNVVDSSGASASTARIWNFGDGYHASGYSAKHLYAQPGTYDVCLKIIDSSRQCSDSICIPIKVDTNKTCRARFSYSKTGTTVSFSDHSISNSTRITTWNFGDGQTTTNYGGSTSHTYAYDRNYMVCLSFRDSITQCTSQYCETINIRSCRANFGYYQKLDSFYFTDSSYAQNAYTVIWSFGDGTSSTQKNPVHVYAVDTIYTVSLTIYDSVTYCQNTYTAQVRPAKKCNVDFTSNPIGGLRIELKTDWNSFNSYTFTYGDGTSGNSFQHTYAQPGTYTICLTAINNTTHCTTQVCKQIPVDYTYSITGQVLLKHQNDSVDFATVYLIRYDASDSSLHQLKNTFIHSNNYSYYKFIGLTPGTYYVKAALDSNDQFYSDYLPTYYEKSTKWKNADAIVITNTNITGADITMKKGNNPGGPGFVAGKISQGANKKEGDPLEGLMVAVYDKAGEPIAYTYSDANGNFRIENLPYGTFEVHTEVLGIETEPFYVTLDENNKGQEDIEVKVSSTQVYTSTRKQAALYSELVKVYPNPVENMLILQLDGMQAEQAQIQVLDITGKLVMTQSMHTTQGNQQIQLDATGLSQGMYLLKIEAGQKVMHATFMKQ